MAARGQASKTGDFVSAYADRYAQVHPNVLERLLEWMLFMRDRFDGDLDLMIIFAVVYLRRLGGLGADQQSFEAAAAAPCSSASGCVTNRKSIADSTGIPRETVRRKVVVLLELGLLEECESGCLTSVPFEQGRYKGVEHRSFEILARLSAALSSVVQTGERGSAFAAPAGAAILVDELHA